MAHPYTTATSHAIPAQLASDDAELIRRRMQNDQADLVKVSAAAAHAELVLNSRLKAKAVLERSIEDARQALGETDVISLLTVQGSALDHAEQFGGPHGDGHDSGFFSNPRTAVMPPVVDGDPQAGFCINCGAPVWRKDGGLVHGFGNPECNSADDDTKVATLADADGEVCGS